MKSTVRGLADATVLPKQKLLLGRSAMLVKGFGQHFRDGTRVGTFNLEAVQREDGLAVAEDRHGRGRRRNAGQQFADTSDRINVCTGENGGGLVWPVWMVERDANGGAGFAGGAATHGISDHQNRPAAGRQKTIDVFRGSCFFHPILRQILTHGNDKVLWVTHVFIN